IRSRRTPADWSLATMPPTCPSFAPLDRLMDSLSIEPVFVDRVSNCQLGLDDVRRVEQAVASGADRPNDRLGLSPAEHSLHYQRVGNDETGELELLTQQVGENLARERCWCATWI